jgi:hypothetical protein
LRDSQETAGKAKLATDLQASREAKTDLENALYDARAQVAEAEMANSGASANERTDRALGEAWDTFNAADTAY